LTGTGRGDRNPSPDNFQREGHFEAYVKYVEDCRQARAEGKNPELVDFIRREYDDDDLSDAEDTVPLGGEATPHEGNDDETMAHEASDEEDPSI